MLLFSFELEHAGKVLEALIRHNGWAWRQDRERGSFRWSAPDNMGSTIISYRLYQAISREANRKKLHRVHVAFARCRCVSLKFRCVVQLEIKT